MWYLLVILFVLGILVVPQLLIISTLKRYNSPRDDIPGSGGEFANHLIHKLSLGATVRVEPCNEGDHYDPQDKAVRLNHRFFNQHSLAALVIAAHEVGHAIQDAENHHWMRRRERLLRIAAVVEKIAPLTLALAPLVLLITKVPGLSLLVVLVGLLSVAMSTLLHLITLPVELDASFNKALPILEQGNYLPKADDHKAARRILRAAALTYVAGSLLNVLNIGYWLRTLAR